MPNQFLPKSAPIWGWPMNLTIADFPASNQPLGTTALTNAPAGQTTRSAALTMGARSVQITFQYGAPTAFTLNLYGAADNYTTPIKTWQMDDKTQNVYAGNLEHVDLQGQAIKVEVVNPTNVIPSVTVRVTS